MAKPDRRSLTIRIQGLDRKHYQATDRYARQVKRLYDEAAQEYAAHDPEIARGILSMLANDVRIDHDSDGPRRIELRLCPAIPAGGGNER